MRRLTLLLFLLAGLAHAQTCTPGNGITCTSNLHLWVLPNNYAALSAQFGKPSTTALYSANWLAIDKAMSGLVTPNFNTIVGGTNPNALLISGSMAPTGGGAITATALAGTPSINVNNLHITGTCTGCPGSGSLPSAPATQQQVLQADSSGVAHAVTEANTFIDPVNRHAVDNTGSTQVGATLTSFITALPSSNPAPIILAPGIFNVSDGFDVPCSSTVCSGLVIQGSGRWATTIQSNCSGTAKDVLRLAKSSSGSIFTGFTLAHMTIRDTSGTGACRSLLDIVNQAGFTIDDVAVTGAKGKIYSTGTITATNGSTAVVGSGTTWVAAMCPGLLQVAGYDQECNTVVDATHITLTSTWQAPTASGAGYAIDYYGNGLMLEPGANAGDYTQYGTIRDLYSTANRVCIYSAGTSSGGVSGITLTGSNSQCEVRGSRTTDSVGHFWGLHTDTVRDETPINNVGFGLIIEGAHANFISPRLENDSNVTPITTCNGGVGLQSCTIAIQIAATGGSTGGGNVISGLYALLFGDVIKTVGTGATTGIDLQIYGFRMGHTFAWNSHNYNFNGTTGCPATGSGVGAVIQTYDCNHVIVAQTVN